MLLKLTIIQLKNSWVLDTGCGAHICSNVQGLTRSRKVRLREIDLQVDNGSRVNVEKIGSYVIDLPSGFRLELNNCYFVPSITKNIISIPVLDNEGFSFRFANNTCYFSLNGTVHGTASLVNGLYMLNCSVALLHTTNKRLRLSSKDSPSYLWHYRLGRINDTRIARLIKLDYLTPFDLESHGECESCLNGKMISKPFKGKGTRAHEPHELIHTDVCGPFPTQARGGFPYFITFTDDFSRFGYVYLMKNKYESFEKFKEFRVEVEKQLDKSIKSL